MGTPLFKVRAYHIYTREIPYLVYHPENGVVRYGAQIRGLCRPHTQKQTQNKCVHDLHMYSAAFYACLSIFKPQTAVDAGDIRT